MARRLMVGREHVIVQGRKHCLVESRSHPGEYHTVSWEPVEADSEGWVCTCESFQFRADCRHVRIIRLWNLGDESVDVSFE